MAVIFRDFCVKLQISASKMLLVYPAARFTNTTMLAYKIQWTGPAKMQSARYVVKDSAPDHLDSENAADGLFI